MQSFDVISKPSFYLDDAYYEALITWRDEASTYGPATDTDVVASSASLIHYEARLLDTRRFYEWIDLYTEDCIYWLPSVALADPRREVTVTFDDRRRMLTGAFLTTEVNKLVDKQLLKKVVNPRDKRRVILTVTEKGADLLATLAPLQQQVNDVHFGSLSKEEFEQLHGDLCSRSSHSQTGG